jgi:hypothetical protein
MGKDRNEELQNMLGICCPLFTFLWVSLHFLPGEKFISQFPVAEINRDNLELAPKEWTFLPILYFMKVHYFSSKYTSPSLPSKDDSYIVL